MNDKGWPYTKVLELAQQANQKNFKMQLAGFFQADNPQIVCYKNKDFYNYHYSNYYHQLNETTKSKDYLIYGLHFCSYYF